MTRSTIRGRELVEWQHSTGVESDLMLDAMDMCAYYESQRRYVAAYGRCEDGCTTGHLIRIPNGRIVCYRSRDLCPHFALSEIVSRYSGKEKPMATDLETTDAALVPFAQRNDIIAVDNVLAECRAEMRHSKNSPTMAAFVQAKAIARLRELITTNMMRDVMALANTPLGFRTDRPPGKGKSYTQDEIKECVIVALLSGCRLVGNEFNIIAGNFYITKEGLTRAVGEFPGLMDLKLDAGVPNNSSGGNGALVPYHATWKLHGVADEIHCTQTADEDTRIPVRVNEGMGADAILGKAKRKIMAKVLERLTGTRIKSEDEIEGDVIKS